MPIFHKIFKNSVFFDNSLDAQQYQRYLLINNMPVPTIYTPQMCLLNTGKYASNMESSNNLPYMFRQLNPSLAKDLINIKKGNTIYLLEVSTTSTTQYYQYIVISYLTLLHFFVIN
jgi:hypothetical protein